MATQIKLRRDTAANWLQSNPTLAIGEPGWDTTNKKLKIGDGINPWDALAYFDDQISDLSAVAQNIVPSTDNAYNIGSPAKRWKHGYFASGSLYVGDLKLSNNNGTLLVQQVTDAGLVNEAPVPNTPGVVTTDRIINGIHELVLDANGTLNVNNNNFPSITGADGVKISTTDGKELMLDWVAAAVNPYPGIPQLSTSVGAVSLGYGGVTIEVNNANGGGYWTFAPTGALTHSVGSATKTVNNNLISGVATQVVWTSTYENISGAKLTIQVECGEGGSGNWETQVCEAIVAVKGYNSTTEPQMVIYGVIHTSVAPLMTFTIQRNPTTSLIEIVGTRTLTANPLGNASLTICSVETRTND